MLNKAIYQGRLTADPVMRFTGNQTPVCSFSIAVERDFKNEETGEKEVDYFSCVAWRKTGEFIKGHFEKGDMILATGRNQSRWYKDKNGNNRDVIELVIDNAYFCNSKKSEKPAAEPAPNNEELSPAYFTELAEAEGLPF